MSATDIDMNEVRKGFNDAIANVSDPDRKANLEMVREFFCNPKFRRFATDLCWTLTQGSDLTRRGRAPRR